MPLDGPLDLVPQWKTLKKPAGAQLNTNSDSQSSGNLQPLQLHHQPSFRPQTHQQLRPSQSQRDYHNVSSPFADFSSPAGGPTVHSARQGAPNRASSRWLESSNSGIQRGPSLQPDARLSARDRALSLPHSSSGSHAAPKVGFHADFPCLQDTAHSSNHATPRVTDTQPTTPVTPVTPKPSPYSFLADRVSTNWTSKLAIAPHPPPAAAPAAEPPAHETIATPTSSSPAPVPAAIQPGWGASSTADGSQRPRLIEALVSGGVDGSGGKDKAANSVDPEAFRAQLAVRQSKQLIPVIARKGDGGATAKPATAASTLLRQTSSFKQAGGSGNDGKLLLRLPSATAAQPEERMKSLVTSTTAAASHASSGMVPLLKSPSRRATTSPDPAVKLGPIKTSTISDGGVAARASDGGASTGVRATASQSQAVQAGIQWKGPGGASPASSPQQDKQDAAFTASQQNDSMVASTVGHSHQLSQPSMRAASAPGNQPSSTTVVTSQHHAAKTAASAAQPPADAWGDEDESNAAAKAGASPTAALAGQPGKANSTGGSSWDGAGDGAGEVLGSPMLKDGSAGSSSMQQSSNTSSIDGAAHLMALQPPATGSAGKLAKLPPPSSWEETEGDREEELVLPPEEEAFLRALGWTDCEEDGDEQSCELTEEEIAAFKAAAAAMAHSSRCTTPHIDQTPIQSRTTSPLPYLSWSGLPAEGSTVGRISTGPCGSSFEGASPTCVPQDAGSPCAQDPCEVVWIEPLFPGVSKGWFAGTFAQ